MHNVKTADQVIWRRGRKIIEFETHVLGTSPCLWKLLSRYIEPSYSHSGMLLGIVESPNPAVISLAANDSDRLIIPVTSANIGYLYRCMGSAVVDARMEQPSIPSDHEVMLSSEP